MASEGTLSHPKVGHAGGGVKPPIHSANAPFRTAFCRAFNLSEERFEVAVLRRCFPWWSRALGAVVLAVNPGVFRREFRTLAQLGRATDPSQFAAEFEAYIYETVRDKAQFRTRTLGLRLSRRRFERLAAEVRSRLRGEGRGEPVGTGEGTPAGSAGRG